MPTNRYAKGRIKLKKGEYQRSNGTFEYKWTDRYGSRHSLYAKTLDQLRLKEESVQKDILDGLTGINLNITINSYYEIWLRIKSGVRGTSLSTYQKHYQRYIEPCFGNTKLKDLNYSKIVMFYKDLIESRGLSISTIRNVNVVLSMILNVAIRDGVLRTNPCEGAIKELNRKYSNSVKKVRALTRTEQEVLEEYLSRPGTYHCMFPIITVMLYTGVRPGEAAALRYSNINFIKDEINITHTLVEDKSNPNNFGFNLNPPKTKNSERCLPLIPIVKEALITEKKRQEKEGIKCSTPVGGHSDFVFLDNNGRLYGYKKLNHRLDRISIAINNEIKRNGPIKGLSSFPHVHSHMLRHSFATRMREAHADLKATADILGHYDEIKMTLNTYTDASAEFKKQEIARLDPHSKTTAV